MEYTINERCHIDGLYRHFKGGIYRLLHVGKHTETGDVVCVYECRVPGESTNCISKTGDIWVRPYDMFFSEVDHEKYPDVEQKYRMEYVPNNTLIESAKEIVQMCQLNPGCEGCPFEIPDTGCRFGTAPCGWAF